MTVGLQGTLTADDILSQAEALRRQQEAMLAQRTQAATQQAQQAQQAYGDAAAQPPAQLDPNDQFVQTLIGNLASTIGGEPSYREKAQENIKLSKVSLIQQRKANLEALQGAAEQSAKAAAEAGDHEQEIKIRSQIESRNKALDQLNREADRGATRDAAQTRANNANQRDLDRDRNAKNSALNSLTRNVKSDKDVDNFIAVRDGLDMGLGGAKAKSNLGDILLMRSIARISDPASSVREEEFKTFAGAQGVMAQYGVNLTNKMWGKGQLTTFGRSQMTAQLRNIYNKKKEQHDRAITQHRRTGSALGLSPEEIDAVIRDYSSTSDSTQAPPAAEAAMSDEDAYQAYLEMVGKKK